MVVVYVHALRVTCAHLARFTLANTVEDHHAVIPVLAAHTVAAHPEACVVGK